MGGETVRQDTRLIFFKSNGYTMITTTAWELHFDKLPRWLRKPADKLRAWMIRKGIITAYLSKEMLVESVCFDTENFSRNLMIELDRHVLLQTRRHVSRVFMGRKQFMELASAPMPEMWPVPITFDTSLCGYPSYQAYGVEIVVIPWMDGILPI